ncbi:3-oxoacyl-[acyl-carrier protein] reductase [Granulicatella balaenopterae]|uniref:3-oxoacyl-[acyl-carrier protein] reductase n=1 Tax=Granulicatella balaenopterae TaxID=137733 RepID=A0A1H9MW82_9LACT|nr:SDR family oxidoreductase [Granulicatella balaenopterae]SER27964.1 3-oxoacyl-[acyl-carrier protein] reductase [Granulicatella balaenopterae]
MKILVTGTTRGIGRAIAIKYLETGHHVIGLDILPASIEHDLYTHITQDICDELPEISDLNIIVNNVGVQESGRDLEVNLEASIRVTEKYAFQPAIKSVLFMASASATTGAEFPWYVASKGGMVAYMRNVALRIAEYKATSNSISAGGVITELNQHILEDEKLYRAVLDETILDKWCDPEEIAELTYYLTIINKSITGEDIFIDNGEKIKSNFIW